MGSTVDLGVAFRGKCLLLGNNKEALALSSLVIASYYYHLFSMLAQQVTYCLCVLETNERQNTKHNSIYNQNGTEII